LTEVAKQNAKLKKKAPSRRDLSYTPNKNVSKVDEKKLNLIFLK
jgi:hypothetical protein